MFRFGDFELDLDRYELRRGRAVVKSEPRVLEVLNFLIEQRARVVPKEELLDTIWREVHVSESALTTAIRDARRALGDSSADPKWIRTVYGRGFRFVGDIETTPPTASVSSAPPPARSQPQASTRKSMAVLPLADLSPKRDQGHLCDGVAEELINTLTRIPELRVISRAAAFDYQADDDLLALGVKLGVEYLLRGSVRSDGGGERLRISVHLVDVRNGHHLWSEKYDHPGGEIFTLQEEIAASTARVLLGVLSERVRKAIQSRPVRLDAYEFYLKGHSYLDQRTPEALDAAARMFEIAVDFDRDYALAYAGLADALAQSYEKSEDAALLQRADVASARAIDLAPQLAETHLCRARVLALLKRYAEASGELEIALSISPGGAEAAEVLRELELPSPES
jgi:TolB-like protein